MRAKTIISAILLSSGSLFAQQPWSLEKCIDYAIENNIDIQLQKIEIENQKLQLNTAKMSRLPDLNASLGESINFGRTTGADNITVDNTASSTSFSIGTSMPLFTGFRLPNQIKSQEFSLSAALEDMNKAKENISLNIMSFYLQVLYYKELQKISQQQVDLTQKQVIQSEASVKAGRVSMSDLYDSKAQLAKDEVSLTEANNNVRLALLDLSQLLNLNNEADFDIEIPQINADAAADNSALASPATVFDNFVNERPAIKAAQYRIEGSRKDLLIARSYYYPTLSLNAGYSNSYYHSYDNKTYNTSFSSQIDKNGSEYVSLNLSIPIFNRFATRNGVRQAKLAITSQQLKLENEKQTVFKEIQQAYTNALAAHDTYISAQKSVEASKLAYQYEETKFKNGRSTSFELSNASTLFQKAQAQQAQALYDYVFRSKILDYYQGKSLLLK